MHTGFTTLDVVFIIMGLVFIVTAYLRGFVKEIFSLINWTVAFLASYFLSPYVAKFLEQYYSGKMAIDIATRSIVFVFAFLFSMFILSGLNRALKDRLSGYFDRSLGLFYGFFKTLLMFGVFYSVTMNVYSAILAMPQADIKEPEWIKNAKFHGIIKAAGEVVDPFVAAFTKDVMKNVESELPVKKTDELQNKIDEVIEKKAEEKIEEKKSIEPQKVDADEGYSKKDIEKMDRLIEIIDKK